MKIKMHAVLYQSSTGQNSLGEPHKTRECAEASISPFEGALVLGFLEGEVELLPEVVTGMQFALDRNKVNG